jgi:hypothetical protein
LSRRGIRVRPDSQRGGGGQEDLRYRFGRKNRFGRGGDAGDRCPWNRFLNGLHSLRGRDGPHSGPVQQRRRLLAAHSVIAAVGCILLLLLTALMVLVVWPPTAVLLRQEAPRHSACLNRSYDVQWFVSFSRDDSHQGIINTRLGSDPVQPDWTFS